MPITLGDVSIGSSSGTVETGSNIHIKNINGVIGVGDAAFGYGNVAAFGRASTAGFHISGSTVGDLCIGAEFGKSVLIGTGASGTLERRMQIDGSGRVMMPNQPAFHVYHTVASSGFPSNSTATWDSVVTNNGSHFKTTAGTGQNQRFIAPVAGYYHFNVMMLSNSSTQLFYRIRKNGTDVPGTYVETYSASNYQTATSTATISLAANDFVEVFVSTNAAYGSVYANFNGFLIG